MKHHKSNALNIILTIVFCVSSFNYGCKRQPQETEAFKEQREHVIIGIALETLTAPLIIAYEKGYFADEGLNVAIKEYGFGKLALEAMFAGEVDVATVAETPIVMNSFKREDFHVIATFVYNYDDSKIIVRKDRGILAISDLKGKKIGTTYGTSAHFFLDGYLTYSRLMKSDVKVINLPQKNLPDALKNGKVDAIAAFEPYAYEAMKRLPNTAMRLQKIEVLRETFNLVATKDFTKRYPETVKKTLKAIDRAVDFMRQNKEESIAVLRKSLHTDEEYLHATWDDYIFGLSLDQPLLLTFEDVARWAIKNKLTDKTQYPNYLDFIYFEGLMAVKPEAVKILR